MRISAALEAYLVVTGKTHLQGLTGYAMQARNTADDRQNKRREAATRSSKLDERYGKIGISAVAAAVRCRGEERKSHRVRFVVHESD
jgi:hypothetical protein